MIHSFIQLPEEILLIILKKMNNFNVLYSLFSINERINAIVNDQVFTKHLSFKLPFNSLSYPFTDIVLDRFCHEILPKINHKIERLDVESSTVERILYTTYYPNLHIQVERYGPYATRKRQRYCVNMDNHIH
jgi:hypothetical protein